MPKENKMSLFQVQVSTSISTQTRPQTVTTLLTFSSTFSDEVVTSVGIPGALVVRLARKVYAISQIELEFAGV